MARLWPMSSFPLSCPQHRGGQSQGTWQEQRIAVPLARSGGVQPILLGGFLGKQEPPKVTKPGQGSQENLTVTGSSDRSQFQGCAELLRTVERTSLSQQLAVAPRPQHQVAMEQPAGPAPTQAGHCSRTQTAANLSSQDATAPGRFNQFSILCSEIREGALVRNDHSHRTEKLIYVRFGKSPRTHTDPLQWSSLLPTLNSMLPRNLINCLSSWSTGEVTPGRGSDLLRSRACGLQRVIGLDRMGSM